MSDEMGATSQTSENTDTEVISEDAPIVTDNSFSTEPTTEENLPNPMEEAASNTNAYNEKELARMSCAELVEAAAVLMQQDELPPRIEIERIKNAFFKQKGSYANNPEFATLLQDAEVQEIRFKDVLNDFKEKNRKRLEELNAQREANLERKKNLLEQLRTLLTSTEDFNQVRTTFHEISENWRKTGPTLEQFEGKIHQEYNQLVEQFYDLKQINEEFREYDFKKNLDAKRELIECAQKLTEMADTVKAVKELHELHDRWRDLGPVARELRETIWQEFKEVSSTIHKRNQEYFDNKHAEEAENLQAKEGVCLQIEEILNRLPDKVSEWNNLTQEIFDLQKKWKTIGYASRKNNDAIYTRYREACNRFFDAKSAFFNTLSSDIAERIEKRKQLADQAEATLAEGINNRTAQKMRDLQSEWNKLGFTPRKLEAEIRERFLKTCAIFFKEFKAHRSSVNAEQVKNLQEKKEIIEEAKQLLTQEEIETTEAIYELINRFHKVGHVPIKEKEVIYKEFNDVIDELMKKFKVARKRKVVDRYETNIEEISSDKRKLSDERDRLNRIKERITSEINTYENNIGFLNISSGGSNPLLKDIEHKQRKLQEDLALTSEKIKLINEKIRNLDRQ